MRKLKNNKTDKETKTKKPVVKASTSARKPAAKKSTSAGVNSKKADKVLIKGTANTAAEKKQVPAKSKKLPANLTAEKFTEVKSGLAAAKEEWGKALESFKAGNIAEAISAANSVKGKAVSAMEGLGMPVPAGAKS